MRHVDRVGIYLTLALVLFSYIPKISQDKVEKNLAEGSFQGKIVQVKSSGQIIKAEVSEIILPDEDSTICAVALTTTDSVSISSDWKQSVRVTRQQPK